MSYFDEKSQLTKDRAPRVLTDMAELAHLTLTTVSWISEIDVNRKGFKQLAEDVESILLHIVLSYRDCDDHRNWLSSFLRKILSDLQKALEHINNFLQEQLNKDEASRVADSYADREKISEHRNRLLFVMSQLEDGTYRKQVVAPVQATTLNEELEQFEDIIEAEENEEAIQFANQRAKVKPSQSGAGPANLRAYSTPVHTQIKQSIPTTPRRETHPRASNAVGHDYQYSYLSPDAYRTKNVGISGGTFNGASPVINQGTPNGNPKHHVTNTGISGGHFSGGASPVINQGTPSPGNVKNY
ncbi:hypothetical protein B0H34DRAFT_738951 [Crassisporium funariophilum]|nr:hypothetical protein B0H34DRAFT_738951 [Crassisporium funariophilum]